MSFVKRLWKDRISQYPNRRTINDGNVTKQVTVGRDEGTVTEQGDAFNASNMNDLEDRIYAAIEQGGGGGGGGTYDYAELTNKPQVNGNELSGDKTTTDLGIYGSNTQMSAIDTTKVADKITALTPQRYRYVGQLLDSNGGTIKGCGEASITLQNGIARIDFGLMIETADETSNEVWGINSNFFTSVVGKTITASYGGVITYYTAAGALYGDRHGYCGNFTTIANRGYYWKPARVYKSGSTYSTGSWASGLFGVGVRMMGTCWGTYT